MSIWTGRDGYDAIEDFSERTRAELANLEGELFKRDTELPARDVAFVTAELADGESVLELGCGLGPWFEIAETLGLDYVGVDPVDKRVEYASKHHPSGEFLRRDARTLQLPRHFDRVLLCTVLQHLPLIDALAVLRSAADHCAPGGKIILIEAHLVFAEDVVWALNFAEEKYLTMSPHVIPKPQALLRKATPGLRWRQEEWDLFVLEQP